ncbi:MAG: protein kinase [Gemmatimonadaceae bacterium]|nr:protein kinase [Gemmatimonadaceae bacterium]
MSRVFLAEETALRRQVAIKLLSPELAQGLSVDRFEREILTAAALQQANIVPVLSSGQSNGLPFYTMPFVEGESLRARLARGPLAIAEVIGVLRDVAKALAYAHQRGVVHRDIKPDNILLSGGTAVVTDFGIAKAISASRTGAGAGATLTQIGTSIGTPAYMAPEQAAGDPNVDHRADLYSLGALAYELLTGQPVFANRTPQRMLAAHMGEAPQPVSALRPDTPAPLAELVMRCLAKEANDRPQQAADIARTLDSITSGSGLDAMPAILLGGPGMFRKAIGAYAAAFVLVAVMAKAAIVGIGLPDWVFPGSLIVMALGLPVVLWTGYVQRVVRRAATATPTFTPGGTPSMVHGTMATMALKAAPHVSWYRTARGGAYALGVFAVAIAAFMGMRAFGIGPFGSLIATGQLAEQNRIVIAEFTVAGGEVAVGRAVTEAVRSAMRDSKVFTLFSPTEVADELRRMLRDPQAPLSGDLARQVALRKGGKAIIDGVVTPVGNTFLLALRLVTADSARELYSVRGTASTADALIDVADDLSRKLRSKAGESLRRVQATQPLGDATTASLEALRKYGEAVTATDIALDRDKAIRLLREAIQIDSSFAEAWRKLAVTMSNRGGFPQSSVDSVADRALALSERLSPSERDAIIAVYYQMTSHRDRAKRVAAYERMLARGDTGAMWNNLALALQERREFARVDSMFRGARARLPDQPLGFSNGVYPLLWLGKFHEAESLTTAAVRRFPGAGIFAVDLINIAWWRGRMDSAVARFDSAMNAGNRRDPRRVLDAYLPVLSALGRLQAWDARAAQLAAVDSGLGRPTLAVVRAAAALRRRAEAVADVERQLQLLDAAVAATDFRALPAPDRPYLPLAGAYARAGRSDRARALLARFDAEVRDTAVRRVVRPELQAVQAEIALAEKRFVDGVRLIRESRRLPDGPVDANYVLDDVLLIRAWAMAGQADSAIAAYESYRASPLGRRERVGPDVVMPAAELEALAKIYDAKGNTARAVELYRDFVEIWKNADPELQPRVAAARARLRTLTPSEPARR